jgi:hypothetical protein
VLRTAPRRAPLRTATVLLLSLALALGTVAPALASPPNVGPFPPAIDDYSRYEGQSQCLNVEQPGVQAFRDMVMRAYPNTGRGGILRGCNVGGRSEHKEGRAWDWMVDANVPHQRAAADQVLAWLLATDEHGNEHALARRFGVMYIIWNRQVWSAYRPHQGWQPYTGAHPHTDHVHFSFSWAGARKETSGFTGGAPIGSSPAAPVEPDVFPDVPRTSTLHEPVSWLAETGITTGDRDGNYRPASSVTRGQMASFLWRLMGQPGGAPDAGFPDVSHSSPHLDAIAWLADAGITEGDADGAFRPDDRVTRGQMSLFLWRTVGQPNGAPPHGFRDVAQVHDAAVSWLADAGITTGTTPELYAGKDPVTRGQMAVFLHRLTGNEAAWSASESLSPTVRF